MVNFMARYPNEGACVYAHMPERRLQAHWSHWVIQWMIAWCRPEHIEARVNKSHSLVQVLALGLGLDLHVLYIDGLVQERRNSSALTMELCLSCTYPSIYMIYKSIGNIPGRFVIYI